MLRALVAAVATAVVVAGMPLPASQAAGVVVTVATYNAPHREGLADRRYDLRRLDARGVSVVALQENTDGDPERIKPTGWSHYRPAAAKSAAVIWDRAVWVKVRTGHVRIDRPGGTPDRYLVWVHLRHKASGKVVRFASVHLVAWPYKTNARAAEHRHQVQQVASWINGGRHRVVAADWNSAPGHARMAALRRVADVQTPVLVTIGRNSKYDYVVRNDARPRPYGAYTLNARGSNHRINVAKVGL